MFLKNTQHQLIFENNAILLHSIIKSQINENNFKSFCQNISNQISPFIHNKDFYLGKLSYNNIDKLIKRIIQYDEKGDTVYSCVSISVLIHIYLCFAGIESHIIIGSCIVENKMYSHAWVRTINNRLFDYRFDNYKYREIKKINFMNLNNNE